MRHLLRSLEIDRAVFFALCLRLWQLLGGAGTVVLISLLFTAEQQGYYYTFAGLVALQTFFELGLNVAVLNVSSHQWAALRLDRQGRIRGQRQARSRLVSLGRLLVLWYGVACLLFVVAVSLAGSLFLAQQPAGEVAWQAPWLALVLLSGLSLWTLPFVALLEGCNQVVTVQRLRLVQGLSSSLAVWAVMALGGGLWAPAAAVAARLLCDLYLLAVRYRRFFAAFLRPPKAGRIDWWSDVWPLQWKLAAGVISYYFANYLFTPVLFHYHGPELAGRMGMTWAVLAAVQAAATAWVQTRSPRFGMLVARRQFGELDRLFFRVAGLSVAAMLAAGAAYWTLIAGLDAIGHPWLQRVLPPLPTALLVLALVVHQVLHCQDYYVRAHHREPYLALVVLSNLAVGVLVWLLGKHAAATGAAAGLLAVYLVKLPLQTMVWSKARRQWHG